MEEGGLGFLDGEKNERVKRKRKHVCERLLTKSRFILPFPAQAGFSLGEEQAKRKNRL